MSCCTQRTFRCSSEPILQLWATSQERELGHSCSMDLRRGHRASRRICRASVQEDLAQSWSPSPGQVRRRKYSRLAMVLLLEGPVGPRFHLKLPKRRQRVLLSLLQLLGGTFCEISWVHERREE